MERKPWTETETIKWYPFPEVKPPKPGYYMCLGYKGREECYWSGDVFRSWGITAWAHLRTGRGNP